MSDRDDDFLRRRLPGGRLLKRAVVTDLMEAVETLERAAARITVQVPDRLTHVLTNELQGDEAAAVHEAWRRIRTVEEELRALPAIQELVKPEHLKRVIKQLAEMWQAENPYEPNQLVEPEAEPTNEKGGSLGVDERAPTPANAESPPRDTSPRRRRQLRPKRKART
jgi:hypothetical protein